MKTIYLALFVVATTTFTQVNLADELPLATDTPAQPVVIKSAVGVSTKWNVRYRDGEDQHHVGDLYFPKALKNQPEIRVPAVLIIHGGAWTTGDKFHTSSHAKKLAARGYVVFSINYRLAPSSKFPAQLEDCAAALCWLERNAAELQIDVERVGVWGYSAGGHLAALLTLQNSSSSSAEQCNQEAKPLPLTSSISSPAVQESSSPEISASKVDIADVANSENIDTESSCRLKVAACVCGAAPFDLPNLANGGALLDSVFVADAAARLPSLAAASPVNFIHRETPPFFLFHGAKDLVVPISQSFEMEEKLISVGARCEMEVLNNKGHLGGFIDPHAIAASFDFMDRTLELDSAWLDEAAKGE